MESDCAALMFIIPGKALLNQQLRLTVLAGFLDEGIDAALSIVALRRHSGDVVPTHLLDDVHHGLGLVGIRRDHPREEIIARVVTQLRGCRRIAHLGDLRSAKRREKNNMLQKSL